MLAPSGYFGAFFGALFAASAGNGVSAVSADSTTTYPVRSAAASSVSAAYPVRGSVQRDADARLFVWTAPPTLRVLTATNQTVVFPGVNGVFSCRGNTATHVFTPCLGVVLED